MDATTLSPQQVVSEDGSTMKKGSKQWTVENEILERQVLICKAFANSTRLHILDLLGKRDWSAAEIQKELGIQKRTSHNTRWCSDPPASSSDVARARMYISRGPCQR